MLGRPEWFKRRKYSGWGVTPKTWQGWLYTAAILIPFLIFQSLPQWSNEVRTYVTLGWVAFLILDIGHIMITLNKDERDNKIEALSERNAAWVMVLIIAVGILYQAISSGLKNDFRVDLFLVAALFGGMIAKSLSNIIIQRRPL